MPLTDDEAKDLAEFATAWFARYKIVFVEEGLLKKLLDNNQIEYKIDDCGVYRLA